MSENQKQSQQSSQAVSLTPEQLQSLIATAVTAAVAEAKKPYVSEKDLADLEAKQEERESNAAQVRQLAEQKKVQQKICSHLRKDSSCRAVFVHDELNGYMICQLCHAVIRPEGADKNRSTAGTVIFNTDLFNRLFQAAQPALYS